MKSMIFPAAREVHQKPLQKAKQSLLQVVGLVTRRSKKTIMWVAQVAAGTCTANTSPGGYASLRSGFA